MTDFEVISLPLIVIGGTFCVLAGVAFVGLLVSLALCLAFCITNGEDFDWVPVKFSLWVFLISGPFGGVLVALAFWIRSLGNP